MKATLALENGIWYEGDAAGATGETGGEVVFNTSLTGYQEILTDPSYSGQIVTMTAPGDRQLRHRAGRCRVADAAGGGIHRAGRVADGEQLARQRHPA
jgi:carbamoylphosphate synthase small subunit